MAELSVEATMTIKQRGTVGELISFVLHLDGGPVDCGGCGREKEREFGGILIIKSMG